MTKFDSVKDSGQRQTWDTGSRRDTNVGKGRFDLISPEFEDRLAVHLQNGAVKYGDRNWELGQPLSRYLDSAKRHINRILRLEVDEDHPAAAAWNIMAFLTTVERIQAGELPLTLDDLGYIASLDNLEQGLEPATAAREARLLRRDRIRQDQEQESDDGEGTPLAYWYDTDVAAALGEGATLGPLAHFVVNPPQPVVSEETTNRLREALRSINTKFREALQESLDRKDSETPCDNGGDLPRPSDFRKDDEFRQGDRVEAFGAITGRRAVLRRDLVPDRWEIKFDGEDFYQYAATWDDDKVRLLLAGVEQNLLTDGRRV